MPDIANKDAALQLAGKILVERGEVELLTKRDKAFISRTVDRFRPPYGRSSQDVPRTCSIAGTTNFTTFIDDPSGGRRYWPVEAGHGDREAQGLVLNAIVVADPERREILRARAGGIEVVPLAAESLRVRVRRRVERRAGRLRVRVAR